MRRDYEYTEKVLALFLVIFAVAALALCTALLLNVKKCVRGHYGEEYWHAQTYMYMNKMMLPIGGGYYADYQCDEFEK